VFVAGCILLWDELLPQYSTFQQLEALLKTMYNVQARAEQHGLKDYPWKCWARPAYKAAWCETKPGLAKLLTKWKGSGIFGELPQYFQAKVPPSESGLEAVKDAVKVSHGCIIVLVLVHCAYFASDCCMGDVSGSRQVAHFKGTAHN
jgi:hypothetical protein